MATCWPGWADPDMEPRQEPGAQWQYGKLASLAYQLDKPIGTSFGDVELEQSLRVRGFDPSADMLAVCRATCAARGWTFEATRD